MRDNAGNQAGGASWRGAVSDGNRYLACQDLGVEPPVRDLDDDIGPLLASPSSLR